VRVGNPRAVLSCTRGAVAQDEKSLQQLFQSLDRRVPGLLRAEKLQIANLRPTTLVEVHRVPPQLQAGFAVIL
jgi:hypothetical protein